MHARGARLGGPDVLSDYESFLRCEIYALLIGYSEYLV